MIAKEAHRNLIRAYYGQYHGQGDLSEEAKKKSGQLV